MPASSLILPVQNPKVTIHSLQAARTACRTCVRVIAGRKGDSAQRSDLYLLRLFKMENEGINSWLIALWLHEMGSRYGYLSLMLIEE